jgi:hypothetical protein
MNSRLDELMGQAAREAAAVRRLTFEKNAVARELDDAVGRLKATREAIVVAIDEDVDERFRKLVQP